MTFAAEEFMIQVVSTMATRASGREVFAVMHLVLSGLVLSIGVTRTNAAQQTNGKCPTGFATFGDSLSDTGNALNAFPFSPAADAENPPYGETFFGAPAKRFSNGRLVPDFFSLAFRKPLLDAYFATTAFNYRYGVNFASAGSTAAVTTTALSPFALQPWQVAQFIRFKNSTTGTQLQGSACRNFNRNLPTHNPYSKWLFSIEAGGNDVLGALLNGTTTATIVSSVIPNAIGNISIAIQTLYAQSARRFLVFNIPAQGCSTVILTVLGNLNLTTDRLGCIAAVNELVQAFNVGLLQAVESLRQSLRGVTIAVFDYYSANLEILQRPSSYGFNPNLTTTACCGAPGLGTLNYNPLITCGHPALGSNNCDNPDEYVIWDGVHFTDSFYRTISEFALSSKFTDHGTNYTDLCSLDFSNFGPTATYTEAYPSTCNSLFT